MKILIHSIHYAPEVTGIGKYTGEMAEWMVREQHDVSVITAFPYHPDWEVHPDYKGRLWHTEFIEGVRVHRCPLYVPKNASSLGRIVQEFSFLLSSLRFWLPIFIGRPFDAVISISPPFHLGVVSVLYKKLRRVPFLVHIQDLQIDIAKDLGMLKNGRVLSMMFKVESFVLKRATAISTISDGMLRKIVQKKDVKADCIFFPNWVDSEYIKPIDTTHSLRAELGLKPTDKVIIYSGSIGEKQGLEVVIQAALAFITNPAIKFLVFGSGRGKAKLEDMAKEYGLVNIHFYPLQPYEKLAALLATGDIHLVLQKKSASDLVLPSKLTGILAAGGCAIVSAIPGTTLYEVVNKHNMGILIEPESKDALINAIRQAFLSDLTLYRTNARRYAEEYLDKEKILNDFIHRLRQVTKEGLSSQTKRVVSVEMDQVTDS